MNASANADTRQTEGRGERGRFLPGRSGNPGGRPAIAAEVRDLARQHGPHAIRRLVELSRSEDGPVAVSACKALLDRGYGRPEQAIAVSAVPNFDGEPMTIRDPLEAAATYERVMRGEVSPEAVRFASAALPPPAEPAPSSPQPPTEVHPNTTSVGPAQGNPGQAQDDPRIAPRDPRVEVAAVWGKL